MIYGLKADCHEVVSKKVLKGKQQSESTQKIFVGGISQSTTKEVLERYFSSFGVILEARILYDGNTGKSRGFAFVVFRDEESKLSVLDQKVHTIKGKVIEVKEFQSDTNIYSHSQTKSKGPKAMNLQEPISDYTPAKKMKQSGKKPLGKDKDPIISGSTSKS